MSRRKKRRKSRKRLVYGVIAVALILACFLAYYFLHSSPPKVAIVDHLSFFPEQRNPTFVKECTNILEEGGLTWAYHKDEEVTVDFYRNLPSYGTSLIILRVHSAIMKENGKIILPPFIGLFTSELYSPEAAQNYPEDVEDDRLVRAFFPGEDKEYFGIVPKFVEKSMKGKFENAIIVMMGCEGLGYIVNASAGAREAYTDLAEAFRKRGAKVYIGWDGLVSINHTDQATLNLLQSLILDKRTIKRAVTETMEEVGKDPTFNSTLKYHPNTPDVGDYTIPNLKGSLIMNVTHTSPTAKAPTKTKYRAYGQCQSPVKTVL